MRYRASPFLNRGTLNFAILVFRIFTFLPRLIAKWCVKLAMNGKWRPIGILVTVAFQSWYPEYYLHYFFDKIGTTSWEFYEKSGIIIFGHTIQQMYPILTFGSICVMLVMWALDYKNSDDQDWNSTRAFLIKYSCLLALIAPVASFFYMSRAISNGKPTETYIQAVIVITLLFNLASSAAVPTFLIYGIKNILTTNYLSFLSSIGKPKITRNVRLFKTVQGTILLEANENLAVMQDWRAFEYAVAHLMKSEYGNAVTTDELKRKNLLGFSYSGDQGSDVICETPSGRVVVQCKYYSNPVGVKAIDESIRAQRVFKASHMVLVTNHTVTEQCRDAANACGVRLITGKDLAALKSKARAA